MPLGEGYTVEEQVTGKAEFGGIQLCVYDSKQKPKKQHTWEDSDQFFYSTSKSKEENKKKLSISKPTQNYKQCQESKMMSFDSFETNDESEMGISSGGKMKQSIYKDEYGHNFWNQDKFGRVFVHIVNSTMYEKITGKKPPKTPVDASLYKSYGYTWYDLYDEHIPTIKKSNILGQVKSVNQIDQEKYAWPKQDNTVNINQVITLKPKIKDSIRDGGW